MEYGMYMGYDNVWAGPSQRIQISPLVSTPWFVIQWLVNLHTGLFQFHFDVNNKLRDQTTGVFWVLDPSVDENESHPVQSMAVQSPDSLRVRVLASDHRPVACMVTCLG